MTLLLFHTKFIRLMQFMSMILPKNKKPAPILKQGPGFIALNYTIQLLHQLIFSLQELESYPGNRYR